MNFSIHLGQFIDKFIPNAINVIILIFLMLIALKITSFIINRFMKSAIKTINGLEMEKKIRTFWHVLKSVINLLIILVGLTMIMDQLGINIGPIIATAGVAGIAIGFGSQRLVEDFINGIIILTTDQIRVGDVVQIGDKGGIVEKLDFKMITLRDLSGNVHYIRNGKVDIITNMTKDFSYYLMDINVSYKENIEKVIAVIKEVGEILRNNPQYNADILEPIEVLGLDKFDDSAVVIKARIKTKPIKQWEIGRAFNLVLKEAFEKHGIEIPFPQRVFNISDSLKSIIK